MIKYADMVGSYTRITTIDRLIINRLLINTASTKGPLSACTHTLERFNN